jgi:putative ABC transport system permease protein
MSVRERTHEYGVLRAIGFPPARVVRLVLGEAVLLSLIGGIVGVGLVLLLVNGVLGTTIEHEMAATFPRFRAPFGTLGTALVASTLFGVIAGLIPSLSASRRPITDALRRLG